VLGRSIHQKEKKEKKEFKNKALPSLVSLLLFLIILFCQGPFRFEGLFSLSLRLCAVILFFEFSRKQVSGYDTAYLKVGSFFFPLYHYYCLFAFGYSLGPAVLAFFW